MVVSEFFKIHLFSLLPVASKAGFHVFDALSFRKRLTVLKNTAFRAVDTKIHDLCAARR